MSKKATVSASGLSLVLGIMNTSSLSSLTSSVEELKASMTPPVKTIEIPQSQNINLLGSSKLTQAQKIVSSGNQDIDALTVRAATANVGVTTLSQRAVEVGAIRDNTEGIVENMGVLEKSIQGVSFEVETLVGISRSTVDFADKWDLIGTKIYSDSDSTTHISDCKLGLVKNRGNKSAVHFAGTDDPNWAMYTSTPVGKSTDDTSPQGHSGVKGNAIRMRVGNGATEGFMVETPVDKSTKTLLSVDSTGKTTIMSAALGDVGDNARDLAGFSNKNRHSTTSCAVYQEKDGHTKINSSSGQKLYLANNGLPKVTIEPSNNYTMVIDNLTGVKPTVFNHVGHNTITCHDNRATKFRSGVSDTDRLLVSKNGVYVNGVLSIDSISVNEMIRALTSRISHAETASGKTAGDVIKF